MSYFTTFFGLKPNKEKAKVVILGIPFEFSTTFGKGTKFAPDFARIASDTLYPYSPWANKALNFDDVSDFGNIRCFNANPEETMKSVLSEINRLKNRRYVFIGGEHTITAFTAGALKPKRMAVFDAHLDFDPAYEMQRFSHASAIRRVVEFAEPRKLLIIGARSYTPEELLELKEYGELIYPIEDLSSIFKEIRYFDYISVDIDVFEPTIETLTGTPEPGGLSPQEFIQYFHSLRARAVDIVEGLPPHPLHPTAVFIATLVREAVISMQ